MEDKGFKAIFSKIKEILLINNNKNEEIVIFKQLQNKYDFRNDSGENGNSLNIGKSEDSFQKKYLNKIINGKIMELLNFRFLIPIIIIVFIIVIGIIYIFFGFELALAIVILVLLIGLYMLYLPKIKKSQNTSDISKELPYALRQMVTELRSGKGLHDTMVSIANSNYGSLSSEFFRALEEIKYGENTEKALINMSKRVNSKALDRVVRQIIGTLKTGGNLSNNLNIIAEDLSHDLQIKLKDYSQKLNAFIMIYTFLAILGPVILLIMLMAASTVMGDVVPSTVVLIMYIFFFPMIVVFMGFMIKRLEPSL